MQSCSTITKSSSANVKKFYFTVTGKPELVRRDFFMGISDKTFYFFERCATYLNDRQKVGA